MNTEIRIPRATALIENVAIKVSAVSISATASGFPSCSLSVHPPGTEKGAKAVELGADYIIRALEAFQRTKFEGVSTASTVDLDDGNKGTLRFVGYLSQPEHQISRSSFSFGVTLVGLGALVQNLRTNIYASTQGAIHKSVTADAKTGSIAARLKTVLQAMIKEWQTDVQNSALALEPDDLALNQRIHANNAQSLVVWYAILTASEATTNIASINGATDDVAASITEFIRALYLQASGDFLSVMLSFCDAFKLRYVPALSFEGADRFGKFVSMDYVADNAIEKEVSSETLATSLGARNSLATAGTLVRGLGNLQQKDAAQEDNPPVERVMAFWPLATAQRAGLVAETTPPPWLPAPYAPTDSDIVGEIDGDLDPTQVLANVIRPKLDSLDRTRTAHRKILEEWARFFFIDSSLGNDTVVLQVPLDFTWKPGTRYKVRKTDGGVLVTGFLASLSHSFAVEQKDAQATTVLTFTHVEAGAYSLPDKR